MDNYKPSDKVITFLHSWLNGIKPNSYWKRGHNEQTERYFFASKYIKGDVLDYGCCLGNGSAILSDKARSVYAVDSNDLAIELSELFFKRPNIKYIKSNTLRNSQIPKQFDSAVVLETIDHFNHPDRFMEQLTERTKGKIVLSVCNSDLFGDIYSDIHPSPFNIQTFKDFCKQHFKTFNCYGQKANGEISPHPVFTNLYFLAVGSGKAIL